MLIKKLNTLTFICIIAMFLNACNSSEQPNDILDQQKEDILQHNIKEAKSIFYMLPSPIETASLLQKAGAEYDGAVLNPVENVSKYELANTKAVNLGIYGSDLSYASVFDQTQEVMFYLSACKKLADGLGLTNAFDGAVMDRMEENINDKDSLMHLISDSYWMADAYLQENERSNLSALIISGGWIEGLYIATKLSNNNPNEALIARITDQKHSLVHLLEIINTYKDDHGDVKEMYDALHEISQIFEKGESTEQKTSTTKDEKTGVTTIGGSKKLTLSPEMLNELSIKIETLRNRYIQ